MILVKYFRLIILLLPLCTLNANPDDKALASVEHLVYKKTPSVDLNLYLFKPEGWDARQKRPAIVFYFGGGWNTRHITQFVAYAEYYSKKGFVCFIPNYRVRSTDDTSVIDSVEDAQDAFAFIRKHAENYGIDPGRIASAGGSAGGHLAATLGTVTDERNHLLSKANAMVLFNPVLIFDPQKQKHKWYMKADYVGIDPYAISPFHHIDSEVPPTIIYHGTADELVPYADAKRFHAAMIEAGLWSRLIPFEGRGHGFFNQGKHIEGSDYHKTLEHTDAFLQGIGWMPVEALY